MLQSIWVPDSVPTRCVMFGPIDEIVACKSNAEICEAYADTGEILYHWRGREKWVVVVTHEVTVEDILKAAEFAMGEKPLVIEDPPVPLLEPEAPLAPVVDLVPQEPVVVEPVVEASPVVEVPMAGLIQPPQDPVVEHAAGVNEPVVEPTPVVAPELVVEAPAVDVPPAI